jgi:rod shape-determining protein MreC
MNQRRVWGLFVGLVITAMVLVTLDFRDEGRATDAARDAASVGFEPFERGLTRLVGPFRRAGVGVRDLVATRAENQLLRAEVELLRERRRAFADLEREIAELRELLDYRATSGFSTATGRVISISPSNFEWTLTIDIGERDGVERGMAVVNGDGLVGRVLSTTATASRVLLAVDPNFSVAARSVRGASLGVIDGRGAEPMRFDPLDPTGGVREGDEVVTATFPGSAVPAGIPIGRVSSSEVSGSRLATFYDVRPFVDIVRLDHVLVVLAPPAPVVPPFEDSDALSVPRPGVTTGPVQSEGDDLSGGEG